MPRFLWPHACGILEPENDSRSVCQERTAFIVRVLISRFKEALQFPVIHDIWHAPLLMAEIICRKDAGCLAGHGLVSAKVPECSHIRPDSPSFADGIEVRKGYLPCEDTGVGKVLLTVAVKSCQLLRVA